MFVIQEENWSVCHLDWAEWRQFRSSEDGEDGDTVIDEFCACCWGAGSIWADAANGEGLIPERCDACLGGGRTRVRHSRLE